MKYRNIVLISLISLSLGACATREQKIQKEQENNPRYQYNVGVFYLNNQQPDEAMKYLRKALALKPDFDLALDGMGLAYSMKGDAKSAVPYFEKCLALNATLTDARNHLGSAYQELGILDKAEEAFRTASMDQTYHSRELPLYNLANLYYLQDRFKEALNFVNQALTVNARLVMGQNLRGLLLEQMEDYSGAISSYQSALKYIRENPEVRISLQYNLAGAFFKNKDYDKARELFLLIQPNATDPEMKTNIAKYLEMLGKRLN